MMDLTKTAAYADLTPYDLWQESEHIRIVRSSRRRRSHVRRLRLRDPAAGREQAAALSVRAGDLRSPRPRGDHRVERRSQKANLRMAGRQSFLAAAQHMASAFQCPGRRERAVRRAD